MAWFGSLVLFLVASLRLAEAWPTTSPYAKLFTRADEIKDEYDYIIVGGGTAGLTVGDRLTEDGKYSVLVIEYGLFHNQTGMTPSRMFNITSLPSPGLNDRTFSVGIGAVVGGSSAVNGQVFLRGTREEYDAWKTLGGPNSTWDWEGILPYFKKGITLNPPDPDQAREFNITYDPAYWGTTSKIFGSFGRRALPALIKLMYSAMKNMPGVTVPEDSGAGKTGLYWYPISQDGEAYRRSYARTGHWDGLDRPNYEMIVGAKANRILFDGEDKAATGVQFVSRNGTAAAAPVRVRARKEVILAAGAIHTPQVLMLSGVGPAARLAEARLDVLVDLPGVGSNFQDHSYIPRVAYAWGVEPDPPAVGIGQDPDGPGGRPNLAAMLGLPVVAPERYADLAAAYEAQDPAAHLPAGYTAEQVEGYRRQQRVYAALMRSPGTTFLEVMLSGPGGAVQNLHCMSRGTVLVDAADPEGEVLVDYRAGSNPIDLAVMAEMVRFMRRYMTTGELAPYAAVETSPGPEVDGDAALVDWARGVVIPSVFHPVGTAAKMPREWGGVVGEDLLVHGTRRLSVVDGSILPTTVGATTSMTVYAIAEKAADIIKSRQ